MESTNNVVDENKSAGVTPDSKPVPPIPARENLPASLLETPRWLTWDYEWREGKDGEHSKWTKPPLSPRTGRKCDVTDKDSWTTFDVALAAAVRRGHGVGFALGDGWAGVDLDECIDEAGAVAPHAQDILFEFTSYTERSPSGTGFHVLVHAQLPPGVNHKCERKPLERLGIHGIKAIELYSEARYFTVTGNVHVGVEVREQQAEVDKLHALLFPPKPENDAEPTKKQARVYIDDARLLQKIRSSKQAAKFERLMAGDTSNYSGDASSADSALCSILAFWLGPDEARIDEWFRRSGLCREKWMKRADYREKTIKGAIKLCKGEFYEPESLFELRADGLWHTKFVRDDEPEETWLCGPIKLLAHSRDAGTSGWTLVFEITTRDGHTKTVDVPEAVMEDFKAVCSLLRSEGLALVNGTFEKARKLLKQWLHGVRSDTHILRVDKVGWLYGVFVLPDETLGVSKEIVRFDGDRKATPCSVAGTLDGWRSGVAAKCVGNSRLIFAVSGAFAAPMLPFAATGGIGFNLFGRSSIGKTTAGRCMASVCGSGADPGKNGFMISWSNTINALESRAMARNHLPMVMDEAKQFEGNLGLASYKLANGSGKGRMGVDNKQKNVLTWQTLVFSTAEQTLTSFVQAAGEHIRGGQGVRIIDIPAEVSNNLGLFEDIHGEKTPNAFADSIKAASCAHYGHAFRAFIERVVANREQAVAEFVELKDAVHGRLVAKIPSSSAEVYRAAASFAHVAAGGELATRWKITGWVPGVAEAAVRKCFEAWLGLRGGVEAADTAGMVKMIKNICATSGSSRFQRIRPRSQYDKTEGSAIEPIVIDGVVVRDSLGFTKIDDDGMRLYLFTEEGLEALCASAGYELTALVGALDGENLLVKNNGGRPRYRVRTYPRELAEKQFYAVKFVEQFELEFTDAPAPKPAEVIETDEFVCLALYREMLRTPEGRESLRTQGAIAAQELASAAWVN